MEQAIIKTYGITKVYGNKRAVNNVSMTINKGDIYGFIGSNGAGKTTLIRLLMGLIRPTAGKAELFGETEKNAITKARQKIGCIVETPSLMYGLNAADCMKAHCLLYGITPGENVKNNLDIVGLENTGAKKVKDFSLGMKQRLAIAQALLCEPEVLILDEPTNGMDPQGIVEIRKLLQKLNAERNMTVMISSHILGELQQLATRFGIVNNGVLIDELTQDELAKKTVPTVLIRTSNAAKTESLLKKSFKENMFTLLSEGLVRINNENDFSAINKTLVKGDVDIHIVAKTQVNLEQYFIDKVGAQNG